MPSISHIIEKLINLFSWKPCETLFHLIMYVRIFQMFLNNASGPDPGIHWQEC